MCSREGTCKKAGVRVLYILEFIKELYEVTVALWQASRWMGYQNTGRTSNFGGAGVWGGRL